MSKRSRSKLATAVALTSLLLVSACGGDGGDGGDGGNAGGDDTLVIGFDSEPTTLDAQKIRDRGKDVVTHRINERLVDFDENVELQPVLAASLPENDPDDPNKWTVTLREGVEFTNGEPWNADALVANIERILDPAYESVYVAELGAIDKATAVDDYTVEITTSTPDPLLDIELRELSIVPPKASQEEGYAENPIGTGPYMFKQWDRGSQVVLEANPDWWGGDDFQVKTVVIKLIPDAGTRMSALAAGEIDIANNLTPSQAATAPAMLVSSGPTAAGFIRLDVRKPPYDDLRFRQALNYAVDKEGLAEAIFNGQFTPAECQITTPQEIGSNPDLEPWPFDPDKARELIAEAGAEGTTLDLEWTSSIYGGDKELGDAVASMYRDVGLEVNLTYNELGPFVDKFYTTDDNAVPMIYGETDNTTNHVMRQMGVIYKPGGPGNVLGDAMPEITEGVAAAAAEMDPETRDQLFQDVQAQQCELAPVVFMLNRVETWGTVEGVTYNPPPAGSFARFYFEDLELS